jgi:hypothetical protein
VDESRRIFSFVAYMKGNLSWNGNASSGNAGEKVLQVARKCLMAVLVWNLVPALRLLDVEAIILSVDG